MELVAEGVVGGLGGLVGRSVAYPFDTLKVKLATRGAGLKLTDLVRDILKKEGVLGLYTGLQFSSAEAMVQKFLYVFMYNFLKKLYAKLAAREMSVLTNIACGYFADLVCVPFCVPFEAMVVQLQSAAAEDSTAEIVRRVLFTREGLVSALKSGRAYIVLSLKPGIEFAFFDVLKKRVLKARQGVAGASADLTPVMAFWLGALCRAVSTLIMYPYSRGKALSQAQKAPTALAAIQQTLSEEGLTALYRGMSMELSRGVTQAAVMFAVMEQLRAVILRAMGVR